MSVSPQALHRAVGALAAVHLNGGTTDDADAVTEAIRRHGAPPWAVTVARTVKDGVRGVVPAGLPFAVMDGAVAGWSAVPARDMRRLAGKGVTPAMLLKDAAAALGHTDGSEWPLVPSMTDHYREFWPAEPWTADHPSDSGVVLGNFHSLASVGTDAFVTLCRIGADDVRGDDHYEFWLIDNDRPDSNPHLDTVLRDAAATVAGLRADGKTVFLHCVAGASRTPTVAALYDMIVTGDGPDEALARVRAVLPGFHRNPAFEAALRRIHGNGLSL